MVEGDLSYVTIVTCTLGRSLQTQSGAGNNWDFSNAIFLIVRVVGTDETIDTH